MNVYELLNLLEEHFPTRFAMQDDKYGLEIQTKDADISNMLVCYEITEQVIKEAVQLNCQLILTYHPFIYFPINTVNMNDRISKLLIEIIKEEISIISLHTRFDTYKYGSNFLFAKALGLEIDKFLEPNTQSSEFGMGIIGHYKNPITIEVFLEKIYNNNKSVLRYSEGSSNWINKVGIVAGSGKQFIQQALENNLDAFITADISYHYFHNTNKKLWLIDAGHWETEQYIVPALTEILRDNVNVDKLNIYKSEVNTNPIKYYWDKNNNNEN